ncbi:hypothetical protein BJY00DRAFT_279993 [Aspergillus carlsbadensis]|nr:hypothetical protein BJY00DRAFT_279993 [Aspergillus carlsbadensis]
MTLSLHSHECLCHVTVQLPGAQRKSAGKSLHCVFVFFSFSFFFSSLSFPVPGSRPACRTAHCHVTLSPRGSDRDESE